ncbi:Pvc16 family protein [Nocardia barduliensis]|uniref:Pvc16 family protein n=1 Tax=Nocardia barduliensis TaxID=2736643 RepID=UPI0015726782|nr:Pvc16 family protein [Nocardia barduliensis]
MKSRQQAQASSGAEAVTPSPQSRYVRQILEDATVPSSLADVEVSFKTPDKAFAPSVTTLDVFLYGVRENRMLRDPEPLHPRRRDSVAVRGLKSHLRESVSRAWRDLIVCRVVVAGVDTDNSRRERASCASSLAIRSMLPEDDRMVSCVRAQVRWIPGR